MSCNDHNLLSNYIKKEKVQCSHKKHRLLKLIYKQTQKETIQQMLSNRVGRCLNSIAAPLDKSFGLQIAHKNVHTHELLAMRKLQTNKPNY